MEVEETDMLCAFTVLTTSKEDRKLSKQLHRQGKLGSSGGKEPGGRHKKKVGEMRQVKGILQVSPGCHFEMCM